MDITYVIQLIAKYQGEANLMLRKLLRVIRPFSKIDVTDGFGNVCSYSAEIEGGITSLNEFEDVADRLKGHMITLVVEGEYDFTDPEVNSNIATGFVENIESF